MWRSLLTVLLTVALPSAAQAYVISPGSFANFDGQGCTLNFVFDGVGPAAGRVFLGSAGHCGEVGGDVLMGPDYLSAEDLVGHVAVRGPYDDADTTTDDDWLLVEIVRNRRGDVEPRVAGHPELPKRVTAAAEMQAGDVLQYSGWGLATMATPATREQRQGQYVSSTDGRYGALAPIVNGDSGGPVVDVKTGGALGIVSSLFGNCGEVGCNMSGPTVTTLIAGAAAQGVPVQLRVAGQPAPPAPPPIAEPTAPSPAPAPAPAPAEVSPAPRLDVVGCIRRGRATVRLRSSVPLAAATLTSPRRRAFPVGRALRLRGRRITVVVRARAADGTALSARRVLRRC
jgi:hypothetical protein